jgi:hypothetical protein
MTTITCQKCKKNIGETAATRLSAATCASCPHCGSVLIPGKVAEIKKKESQGCVGCLAICLFYLICTIGIVVYDSFNSSSQSDDDTLTPITTKSLTQQGVRKQKISKLFSPWDGSHPELTKIIKKTMNDPKSYEHVETVYWDKLDHVLVKTTFRGKNAFGGVVKNSVTAKVDLGGNVIEFVSAEL